jgi:glycosyltransferase involved in cell wall biosynthesis
MAISVIIPTYNRAEFLRVAVDSVIGQSLQEFELIIVDDGSTDDTEAMLSATYQDDRIRYIYQENSGPSAARNIGIKAASYDMIAFLDSDDHFAPQKLEMQAKEMKDNPDVLVSHTQEVWYRHAKLLNQKKKHRKDDGYIFARCLEICAVGMSTIMVKKELLDKVGLFDESMPCCEDYDLWLRASIRNHFLLVDSPLTIKDGGRADQLSWQYRIGMDRFRINSIQKILEEGMLDNSQRELAVNELIRKCTIYGNGCLKHSRVEEGTKYLDIAKKYQ